METPRTTSEAFSLHPAAHEFMTMNCVLSFVDCAGGRLRRRAIKDRLRRAFGPCGIIERIHVSRLEGDPLNPVSSSRMKPMSSRCAYVR